MTHLREATNGGRIQPLITVFAPDAPGRPRAVFDLPRDAVLEVPLRHPQLAWFSELRLRWYAVPVISDMDLWRHGRRCPANSSWIVPPTAGSTTPVFHRAYDDFDASPSFCRHSA